MIKIHSITIRNFLSVGNIEQTVQLSSTGLTLVLGENADIGGANSRNGVGKSCMIQAISYALFGEPLTKIRLDNLTNSINQKAMLVTIDFEANGKPYRIERGRKPNVFRFFKEGSEANHAQGENKYTQADVEQAIGMTHTMFRHIIALNTFTTPFLREKASEQREIIEELLGITQLSQRAEALKALMDITKEQCRDEEVRIKANADANARIEHGIARAEADSSTWQVAQDAKVADLIATIEAMNEIDIEYEIIVFDTIDSWQRQKKHLDEQRDDIIQKITTRTQELGRHRADLVRYQTEATTQDGGTIGRLERQAQLYLAEASQDIQPQISRLQAEGERRRQEARRKHAEAEQGRADLAILQAQLDSPDAHSCTTCGQGLAGTDHLVRVLARLRQQKDDAIEAIKQAEKIAKECLTTAEATDNEIAQLIQAHAAKQAELRDKAATVQTEIQRAREEADTKRRDAQQRADEMRQIVERLTVEVEQFEQDLLVLDNTDIGQQPQSRFASREEVYRIRQERETLLNQLEAHMTMPNPHDAKLEGLRQSLMAIDYAPFNELSSKLKHETFLHKTLTAKNSFVRIAIINRNLAYLNKRLDHYLSQIGLPHEIQFQPDLDVSISLLGRDFDYEQLSRGEMARVNLALSWAFRDVWENANVPWNLMFCDEVLDQGIDGAGAEAAIEVIRGFADKRAKNVFLVSHREELMEKIDHVLTVQKQDQFTTFMQ